MPSAALESKRTRSFDGAEIEYQVSGDHGPWVVLVNGLGARTTAWRHQIAYLREDYRFLAWDYRGLHLDGEAQDSAAVPWSVDTHAGDMAAILAAEDVHGGVWMGWSFGAQVLMETLRKYDAHPDQLVLVNPCYGRRSDDVGRLRRLLPRAFWTFDVLPELIERLVRRAASWPETGSWLKRLGFVASAIDEEALADVVRHFRTVHAPTYFQALRAASTHRIDGMLGAIDVPTLVIVGERDLVTPRPMAEPLARQIPGVELFVVRGATHFVLLEFPELVNLRVEKFLREQGADVSHT